MEEEAVHEVKIQDVSVEKSGSSQINQEVAGEPKAPTTDDLPKEEEPPSKE